MPWYMMPLLLTIPKSLARKSLSNLTVKNLTDKTYYPSTSGNATNTLIPVALGYGREFIFNTKVEFLIERTIRGRIFRPFFVFYFYG